MKSRRKVIRIRLLVLFVPVEPYTFFIDGVLVFPARRSLFCLSWLPYREYMSNDELLPSQLATLFAAAAAHSRSSTKYIMQIYDIYVHVCC